MLDWNPSEFSRLRAQYDWDDARDDDDTRSRAAPAIHLRHRRARRAQVLGIALMKISLAFVGAADARRRRCPRSAALKVLATTPDWGALTTELGGDHVNVYVATTALQDVHRVEAKPSLVARARSADLVVATGAELEIGWLPVLIQESGNTRIQPGAPATSKPPRCSGCWRCRRSSIARSATSIRRAIRTCSSIRTTSRPSRRR